MTRSSVLVVSALAFGTSCGEGTSPCGTGAEDPDTGLCTCPDAADPGSSCELPRDGFEVEAHRGASSARPPGNTMVAFVEAIRLGADVLEGDMQLSADGVVILNHDPTLSVECTYAGEGAEPSSRAVAELTFAEIALFDCHPDSPGVDPPPRVEDVLDLRSRANVTFDLELKDMGIAEADVAMQALVAYDADCGGCLDGRLRIQSFDADVLRHVRTTITAAAGFETSYLTLAPDVDLADVATFADVLAPIAILVDETLVDAAHEVGLRVLPWTVNSETSMCSLIGFGVDGLISDDPAMLAQVLPRCRP